MSWCGNSKWGLKPNVTYFSTGTTVVVKNHPNTCHFDRPTGAEKPLHFVDACITKEAKWGSSAYTGSLPVESKWH